MQQSAASGDFALGFCRLDQPRQPPPQGVQSLAAFLEVGEGVIDRRHAANGAALVVHDAVRNMRWDLEPSHTGRDRAAKVVEGPIRARHGLV